MLKFRFIRGGGTLRCLLFSPLIISTACLLFAFLFSNLFHIGVSPAFATDPQSSTSTTPSTPRLTNGSSARISTWLANGVAIRILDSTSSREITELNLELSATPGGTFVKNSMNVEVSTTNPTGYKLYMASSYQAPDSTAQTPTYTTSLINLDDSTYTIPSLASSNVSEADFSRSNGSYVNRWGYSIADTASYNIIPSRDNPDLIKTQSTQQNLSITPVTIGVNADLSKASGVYQNSLVFSAIANPVPTAYTLSFNLNGGSAPASDPDAFNDMTASEVAAQHTFTIPNLAPEKTDTIFNGWVDPNAESGAKGSSANPYRPGETITILGNEEYVGSVTLTAQWGTPAFWTITTMQEMTPAVCNSVYTPNNGTESNITLVDNTYDYYTTYGVSANGTRYVPQRTLYDIRGADGTGTSLNPVPNDSPNAKSYTIRKLADGNCWMTESLYLPLVNNVGVEASYNDGSTFTYTPTSCTGDTECGINQNTQSSSTYGTYYYYNWFAATAGKGTSSTATNVDVDGSICPKGWKLPSNYTVTGKNPATNTDWSAMSWSALMAGYGYPTTNVSGDYTAQLQASPLSLIRAGHYYNGSFYNGGTYGSYWSSTAASMSNAYNLRFGTSYLYPQNYNLKSAVGFNIRCLAVR